MFAPKCILVPTDFTGDSDKALQEAVSIAEAFRSKVFLIHVDQRVPEAGGDYALGPEQLAAIEARQSSAARENMLQEVKKVTEKTEVVVEIAERHGTTHEEILSYGAEVGADLIVIEPHSKGGLLKGLLGGVVDKLVHAARCPVLVLH